MTPAGEPVRTPEELRVMAEELSRGAERCNDPEHRARLRRKAEQLRDECAGKGIGPGDAGSADGIEYSNGTPAPGARARRPRPHRKGGA
ncbi:DUF6381 family protein [Streptomyces sp. NPDC001514]